MKAALARALMTLAVRGLGEHRRGWGQAMAAEFDVAAGDGRGLGFAVGCLFAAWRDAPTHNEGRRGLAGHALVLLAVIPIAAMLASSLIVGFPLSLIGVMSDVTGRPILNEGNLSALPSLALLAATGIAAQSRLGWLVLERDWAGVAAMGAMIASVLTTLIVFAGIAFDRPGPALVLAAMAAAELGAVAALARGADPVGDPAR